MAKLFDKVSGDFLNSIKSVMEKTLTSAEMKKREEVAKAIERDNPSMPMSKKMAIATSTAKKVAEAKLDPVNHKELEGTHAQRKDKDINNDGKVNDTDRYLHTRRKAVKHAIAKKMKEEAEQIDELSTDTMKRYQDKARTSADALRDKGFRGNAPAWKKAQNRSDSIDRAQNKIKARSTNEEAEQIDEISTAMKSRYKTAARHDLERAQDFKSELEHEGEPKSSRVSKQVSQIIKKRKTGLKRVGEEVEQIDEISTKLATDYSAKAADARGHRKLSTAKLDKRYNSMALAHEKIRGRHAKVPTTEEAEQIDELSKKTLGNYTYKAASELGSKGITTGLKIAADEPTEKNFKKMGNRQRGIAKAVSRMTKEETTLTAEEIEMIEAKMAGVADGALPGNEHMCATKVFHKEWKEGTPVPTMHADPDEDGLIEWYDVMFDHGIERVMTEDMEILDEKMHGHKRMKEESVNEDLATAVNLGTMAAGAASIAAQHLPYGKSKRSVGQRLIDRKSLRDSIKRDIEGHKKHIEWSKDPTHKYHKLTSPESVEKAKKSIAKKTARLKKLGYVKSLSVKEGVSNHEQPRNSIIRRGVEELDELSKNTLHSYIEKSARDVHNQAYNAGKKEGGEGKYDSGKILKSVTRQIGISQATRKLAGKAKVNANEEVEQIDETAKIVAHLQKRYGDNIRKSHVRSAANDFGVGYVALAHAVRKKLGVNRLEEARGRPSKEKKDFTIHPNTKEKLMHDNPEHMKRIENLYRIGTLKRPKTEADQNIVTQLRKASTSMTGGATINFTHGASKHVAADHARRALEKHADMKPHEKEAFQKKIGHSHEQLMKHI